MYKLTVKNVDDVYIITAHDERIQLDLYSETAIARTIKISFSEYVAIMKDNNGISDKSNRIDCIKQGIDYHNYYFENKIDALNAIDAVESRLLLKKLSI